MFLHASIGECLNLSPGLSVCGGQKPTDLGFSVALCSHLSGSSEHVEFSLVTFASVMWLG